MLVVHVTVDDQYGGIVESIQCSVLSFHTIPKQGRNKIQVVLRGTCLCM